MTSTYAQCSLVRVDYASADELCPENHCTEHRAYDNIRVIKYKLHTLVDTAEILLLMNEMLTIVIVFFSISLFGCLFVKEDFDTARNKPVHMNKNDTIYIETIFTLWFSLRKAWRHQRGQKPFTEGQTIQLLPKKDKRTNNYLLNIKQKRGDRATQTPQNDGVNQVPRKDKT
jgi:hypothetical protein